MITFGKKYNTMYNMHRYNTVLLFFLIFRYFFNIFLHLNGFHYRLRGTDLLMSVEVIDVYFLFFVLIPIYVVVFNSYSSW